MNTFQFRSSVMLLTFLIAAAPVLAQQHRSADVPKPIVTADDPGGSAPVPPPPDPGSGFALHF